MHAFYGLHSDLRLLSISENQTQRVILHLKLRKMYVYNALSSTTNISRPWNRVILWMKNERIYEWMDALFQQAIRAEGSRVSERWGFLFLTLRQSGLLWGLTPRGRLKHKVFLGYLHFGLHHKPSPLPAPQPHASSLFKIAAGQVKTEGMPFLSSLLNQRGCEGHMCATPWSTEGS